MLTAKTGALGFVMMACVIACSSGGGGSTGAATSADSFVAQYCELTAPCCEKQGKKSDQAKCQQFYTLFTVNATYDAAKGQQCLDATRADGSLCEGTSTATNDACKGVFTNAGQSAGTKQPGETCEDDDECAKSPDGDVQCSYASQGGATVRKCQVEVRAKENDDCTGDRLASDSSSSSGSSDAPRVGICWEEDGLYCDYTQKKCLRRIAVGDACDYSQKCVTGARCGFTERACIALRAAGEDCEPSASSFDSPCLEKLYCDDATKKCTAKLASGAVCTKDVECEGGCVNGKCGGSSGGTLFICAGE